MNRQQRRKIERDIDKELSVLKRLPEKELSKVSEIIDKVAKIKVDKLIESVDRNLTSLLVEVGYSIKEIKKIQERLAFLIEEDTLKIRELEKESIDMSKLQKEVKVFIEGLIKEGKNKSVVIEETLFKFPKLSKTMINTAYGNIQDELEIQSAAEYILEDSKKVKDVITKEEAKKIAKEVAENLEKEINPVSRLKIKKIELEGEFGKYVKEGDKVIAGDIEFNSIDDLEEYRKKELELFNARINEIKAVYMGTSTY